MIKPKPGISHRKFYEDPKFWVLIGLIAMIGVVVMYSSSSSPGSIQKPKITASRNGPLKGPNLKQSPLESPDPSIMVSKLDEKREEYDSGNRNLFAFFTPPPPKVAEKKDPVAPPPPPVCGDGRCEGGENYQNCESDCPPPPPPEIALKFIGYLVDHNRAVAFLTDGKEVFMGRENDIIANKYRIIKITEDGVELGYLNLNTKQSRTIPFQGNNKS
jgi:hypothetical protein